MTLQDVIKGNKVSHTVALLRLMKNGKYYSNVRLFKLVGWRFSGYLHVLKKKGVIFSKKPGKKSDKHYVEYWKIESIPNHLDYSGNTLKDLSHKIHKDEKGI